MPKKKLKHIELFAGCGGMSLGLDRAGFELYFANELSPMAGETFAYNILGEDLQELALSGSISSKVRWIKSRYKADDLINRLRENPFSATDGKFTDISTLADLKGKLIVGDIGDVLTFLSKNKAIVEKLKKENIDLLSGGPPCQGFSLAGKRIKDDHKNSLPLSFAKFAGLVQPKCVLLENVKGITAPFNEDGEKYYAWLEVAKAFVLEGYFPICMMLNSKYFGVAQNRPRFIMMAFRKDVFKKVLDDHTEHVALVASAAFYELVQSNRDDLSVITTKDFLYYDIETSPTMFDGKILPKMTSPEGTFVSVLEAIGDIRRTEQDYELVTLTNGYGGRLNGIFNNKLVSGQFLKNHEPRKHSFGTQARFRFYQVINEFQNGLKKSAVDFFSGRVVDSQTKDKLAVAFSKHNLYFQSAEGVVYKRPSSIDEVEELLKTIPTKKHSQRALTEYDPAPAQLTIPDDLCHYHMEDLRTLTVREMARFQSFPDWFVFRSKVTTGGDGRKFEVPQYTQVGNAVPPLLALRLGEVVFRLLT